MLSTELKDKLLGFRAERDWGQFHNLRTLSTSIVLEAAELAEITQWTQDAQLATTTEARRAEIEEEVADLAILLTYLVSDLALDLDRCVERKLAKNAEKYPVEKSRGNASKYTELLR